MTQYGLGPWFCVCIRNVESGALEFHTHGCGAHKIAEQRGDAWRTHMIVGPFTTLRYALHFRRAWEAEDVQRALLRAAPAAATARPQVWVRDVPCAASMTDIVRIARK